MSIKSKDRIKEKMKRIVKLRDFGSEINEFCLIQIVTDAAFPMRPTRLASLELFHSIKAHL